MHNSVTNDEISHLPRKSGVENYCTDSRILMRSNKVLPIDNCSSEYTFILSSEMQCLSRNKVYCSLNIDALRPMREKPLPRDREEQAINLVRLLGLFRQLKQKLCDLRAISL